MTPYKRKDSQNRYTIVTGQGSLVLVVCTYADDLHPFARIFFPVGFLIVLWRTWFFLNVGIFERESSWSKNRFFLNAVELM